MKKILLSMALACFGLTVASYAQTIALTQNFEGAAIPALPTGWTMTTTGGGSGWQTNSGTANWQIGTLPAHTQYVFVNDVAHPNNNPAVLTSPAFSLVGVTSPYLAFDQFYYAAWSSTTLIAEQAWIQISTDGGTTYTFLDSITYNTDANWDTKFIDLSSITPSATCKLQFCYRDNAQNLIGVALDNILVYGMVPNFITLTGVTPVAGAASDYFQIGTAATFGGTITNYGSAAVTSISGTYKVGTSAAVTDATVACSAPAMGSGTFTLPTGYTVTTASEQNVSIWVSETGATYLNMDTMATAVYGYGFTPTKRELFEEATGTWCGYCVRGIVYMDSLWKNDSSTVSVISVHDGDPMSLENTNTSSYDTWISSKISGYPSMVIDRRYTDDPSAALTDHANDANLFGFVNMGLTATTTGGNVNVTVQVEPAVNMSGKYQLELVVEEDLVHGTATGAATGTTAGYFQHDYYGVNGSAHTLPTLSGCGYNFTDTVVNAGTQAMLNPSLYFPFVARYTIPDMGTTVNGVVGSLPTSMGEGTVYSYSFAPVTINTVTGTSALAWVPNNLRVVVMLIDANPTSATYGQVLNTANSRNPFVYQTDGIANVSANSIEGMVVFPNPTAQDAHVKFGLSADASVQLSVYDAVGRQVYTTSAQQMKAGAQQIDFSTANFSNGIYNVILHTAGATKTQRLSVVR